MRNKLFKLFFSVCTILFIVSCIDELNVDALEEQNLLVVEGYINTNFGPHEFLLSKSAKYGNVFEGFIQKEAGATLWVRDDLGNQSFLTEVRTGVYWTDEDFKAEVGRTYTLFIETGDGKSYSSLPDKVVAVPEINESFALFTKLPSLDSTDFDSGIEIFAKFTDPEDELNYYAWFLKGVYIINTSPEKYVERGPFGNPLPMPKDCCEKCFVSETVKQNTFSILKDNLSNGQENIQKVGFISDDGGRFQTKYMVAIEQLSLTKDAFSFYKLLNNQISIDGDIFDPPPASISGNIINLDNPDEAVIGYFHASDVASDTLFVEADFLNETQLPRQINDDCRVLDNSVVEEPHFWQ